MIAPHSVMLTVTFSDCEDQRQNKQAQLSTPTTVYMDRRLSARTDHVDPMLF